MGTNWISVGLRLCLLLSLAAFLAETSFAGIIYNVGGAAAGGINCSPVVTATSASCSTSFSGSFGGGQLLANMDAYASATYGALHVGADASLDMTTNPTVVNALVSDAFASVTTQDTFRPSLLTGTLEYQLSIDGSLTQLTPGCFNCRSSLVLTIATTGLSQDFDQQVLVLEGDLGQVSRTLTVDIPYHYLANTSFNVSLALTAGAQAEGSVASAVDWIDTADFQNTLTVLGLGVVGAPGVALNPTSGYQYAGLDSAPEPSTLNLLLGAVGAWFLVTAYRFAMRKCTRD